MNNLVNCPVPSIQGKKEIVVGAKVSQAVFDALQGICDREDRSMSYVLRELALRGMAAYLTDHALRLTEAETAIVERGKSLANGIPIAPTGSKIKLGKLTQEKKLKTQ